MISLLSPAKSLDYETSLPTKRVTKPRFIDDSAKLAQNAKRLSPQKIADLMSISDKLSVLNYDRFQAWKADPSKDQSRAALFAFKGDVYQGLDAYTLSSDEVSFAQQHLRILSGLYGLLRPLDAILPYRLEMGTRFQNTRGKDLYAFWQEALTKKLNQDVEKADGEKKIVNLASNEYFKAIADNSLDYPVISPVFKDEKNGTYKIISFYAKKARGAMARFILTKQINREEDLRDFGWEGYRYNKQASSPGEPHFYRKAQK